MLRRSLEGLLGGDDNESGGGGGGGGQRGFVVVTKERHVYTLPENGRTLIGREGLKMWGKLPHLRLGQRDEGSSGLVPGRTAFCVTFGG